MRALTVEPGRAGTLQLESIAEPDASEGSLLVRCLAIGICGTDREIASGQYGRAPSSSQRLVIGHESLGRVEQAPPDCDLRPGDLIAGIVRRPDPVPCPSCAAGEWDMCRNGLYTERGIRGRHGFGSELFRIEPEYAVRVDRALGLSGVLLEPASVLAKAWEQIERIGGRADSWQPRSVLITGAGPVGLLAALIAVQRGLDTHVFDRVRDGPKPDLVRDLGATYHSGALSELALRPDVVVECTGASSVVLDVIGRTSALGVVCLTGISSGGRSIELDLGLMNRRIVLENDVVFGSVNANRRHYEAAARVLAAADPSWLARLITRRVPLERWREAFEPEPSDVKVVIELGS
jgi:glucose 1-dehydrogenase